MNVFVVGVSLTAVIAMVYLMFRRLPQDGGDFLVMNNERRAMLIVAERASL